MFALSLKEIYLQTAPTNLSEVHNTVHIFIHFLLQTHEISFPETVETIALGHGQMHGSMGQLCVGLRGSEFHLFDIETSIGTLIFSGGELRVR